MHARCKPPLPLAIRRDGSRQLTVALAEPKICVGLPAHFETRTASNDLGKVFHNECLSRQMHTYLKPRALIVDETVHLPTDGPGASINFHLVSADQ